MESPISIHSNDVQCCNILRIDSKNLPNLFKPVRDRPTGDDIYNNNKYFGITVNILPYKSMNKKRWFLYTHDKQRDILSRIESKFRKNNPSVQLIELHYEICPSTDDFHNIHFHALYNMPDVFKAELETYYNKICSDKSNKNWRHLDIKEINNKESWLNYIRKDVK